MTIAITVTPAGGGAFHAYRGSVVEEAKLLCTSSTPFLSAARVLLSEGVDPATPIAMKHSGSDVVSLRATVGVAATLSIRETRGGDFRFVAYRPFPA